MQNLLNQLKRDKLNAETRRHFLKQCTTGLGMMATGSFLKSYIEPSPKQVAEMLTSPPYPQSPHFAGKAKSVIYIHMAGSPSQLELFDYKPELAKVDGQDCPPSFLEGKKFAFIRGVPKMLGPRANFAQYGQSQAWISDNLPHLQTVADEVTFLKAMYTDQLNHAPAQLLMHTGSARSGRPSVGSWVTYGLGSENQNLPGFVVLASGGNNPDAGKSVWGSGFLPSVYQGVQCQHEGNPAVNLKVANRNFRRETIAAITAINQRHYEEFKDPETFSQISEYETAFRMQMTVPEVMDISKEPDYIHEMYGTEIGKASFANNCLLARKLVENGVRFVQLFDYGWDNHGGAEANSIISGLQQKCWKTDRPVTALIKDLKQRGLLEETLIVWGGEFGRTPMSENREGKETPFKGRDHHNDAFTVWMAGGGIKPGFSMGETDEMGYSGIKDRTSVYDLQATILHVLGFNHRELNYPFLGQDYRLTTACGNVIKQVLV